MNPLGTPTSFIATTNADNARHFYEQVLGLECLSEDPYALVFKVGDTTLRIQKVELSPHVQHTVLGWQVTNIKKQVKRLTENGVQFERFSQLPQDEAGIWSSPNGALVAWFKDPDGNRLSLTEPV